MAQTTVLTAGTSAANGDDFTVGAGGTQLTLISGEVDKSFQRVKIPVYIKTGSDYTLYTKKQTAKAKRTPAFLTNVQRSLFIEEPGTYRVVRATQTKSVGVVADDTTEAA
jgi:hypothetical protein